jgi:hypothetical protein
MRRVGRHALVSTVVIAFSLGLGTLGYRAVAQLGWLDAFMNASMILTGMGPVAPMPTPGAKLFASFYALYSGIVFLAVSGIVLAPFLHRMLHRFHLEG